MRSYRLLVFDMGHVNAAVEFDAANDADALQEAKKQFPSEQRELWELRRFVATLQPEAR